MGYTAPGTGNVFKGVKDAFLVGEGTGNISTISSYKYPSNPLYTSEIATKAVATWWAGTVAPDSTAYTNCAWSAELHLFAATCGNTGAVKTSPNGLDWTIRTAPSAATWHGIIWVPELALFVSVGGGSTSSAMTSADGITWTGRTTPNTNKYDGLVWSPELSLLVAVGYNVGSGNRCMTSPDGITWTSRTSAVDNDWSGVAWSPELTLFVAVANSGTGNRVMTSPDGITWTARTSAADNNWDDVKWSASLGLFVAVAYTASVSNNCMTSPDGINWTLRTTPSGGQWTRLAWSPELGMFAATGAPTAGTSNVMTSPDGITWTTHTTPNLRWGGICWSPELAIFCSTSWSGTSMISTQPSQKDYTSKLFYDDFIAWPTTVTSTIGTITTLGTVAAKYKKIGSFVFIRISIGITTNGTGAGHIRATLPFTSHANTYIMAGRETSVLGLMLSGSTLTGAATLQISNYDFTYPGADGHTLVVSGFYEALY